MPSLSSGLSVLVYHLPTCGLSRSVITAPSTSPASASDAAVARPAAFGRRKCRGECLGHRPQAGLAHRVAEEMRRQIPNALVDQIDNTAPRVRRDLQGKTLLPGFTDASVCRFAT